MELRRLSICCVLVILAFVSLCTEARHSIHRRSDDSDEMFNDDNVDTEQNDEGGNETDDTVAIKITSKPETFHMIVGGAVRLYCQLDTADENAVVTWFKGESRLYMGNMPFMVNTKRIYIEKPTHNLVVKDLTFADIGNYTCQVEQKSPVNVTHQLFVEEAPRITDPETTTMASVDYLTDDYKPRIVSFVATETNLLEGQDVSLTCQATGTPQPSLVWSRRRKHSDATEPLAEANGVFNGSTFLMKEVTVRDSGTYYCYAINNVGNAIAHLELQVSGKPHVHSAKRVINAAIGIEADMTCSIHESDEVIEWLKNGERIEFYAGDNTYRVVNSRSDHSSESTLRVRPKADADFGTFTCVAQNVYGSHSRSIDLVQTPVVDKLDARGLNLTWTVYSHQPLEDLEVSLGQYGGDAKWRTYQVPLPEDKKHEYEMIYGLEGSKELPGGDYQVSIKAKNSKGWSAPSEPLIVKVPGENELVKETEPIIQSAAVLPQPDAAVTARPESFLLHAAMMYLLVRMF